MRVSYKRLFQRKNDLNRSLSGKTTLPPPSTTINPIYEYSEELNAAAEHDFSQRRQHLWESCAKLNFIDHYPPNAWEFFISPGHGLAWCNIFKAASSTWMYYFNILGKSLWWLSWKLNLYESYLFYCRRLRFTLFTNNKCFTIRISTEKISTTHKNRINRSLIKFIVISYS